MDAVRPGGRAAFTIWRQGAMEAAGRHLQLALERALGREPQPSPKHPLAEINTVEPYAAWLRERGLADVCIVTHERRLPLTDELAWLVVTGSGFMGALAGLSAEDVDAVRRAYLASLAEDRVTELDATTLTGIGVRPHRLDGLG